jgi:uncharacterized protein YjiS (DUF1127 family)
MSSTSASARGASVRAPKVISLALAWLRARLLKLRAMDELTGLTDADLRDIGMERRDIASVVDRELARLRRNDLGWHK